MRTREDLSKEVTALRAENFRLGQQVDTLTKQRDIEAANALRLIDVNRTLMAALRQATRDI